MSGSLARTTPALVVAAPATADAAGAERLFARPGEGVPARPVSAGDSAEPTAVLAASLFRRRRR